MSPAMAHTLPAARNRRQDTLVDRPSAPVASRHWRVDAKELALACGHVLGREFFGCDNLHYGYWAPDVPVDMRHLTEAQACFSEVLLSQIPAGVTSVLDVGCGTGSVAEQLIQRGYQVDCVSPSVYLTPVARGRLGDTATFYECRFEDLETATRYDTVMFCESLQYVKLAESLRRAATLLKPRGYLVIADFFRTDAKGASPLSGGHRLRLFYEEIAKLPFRCRSDLDITIETAPTVALINSIMSDAVGPIWEMAQRYLRENRPWLSSILHWALRRKIEKFEKKHLAGAITPEAFARFKSYRLMVFQLPA